MIYTAFASHIALLSMIILNSLVLCWRYKCICKKKIIIIENLDSCCHPREIRKCHCFKFEVKGHFWRKKDNEF